MDNQAAFSQPNSLARPIFFAIGTISVALGLLGIFLPLLPTTPFLLLASFCYTRSSQRMHHWLTTNRWCGAYIRNYEEGLGMSQRQKLIAISMLWLAIGYSVIFAVTLLWLKALLLMIAIGVTWHLIKIKTYPSGK